MDVHTNLELNKEQSPACPERAVFVLHRGESAVVMGLALSPLGAMLAAAWQSLALGLLLPAQGEAVVLPPWSRLQEPAASEQPPAPYMPLGLPVRKTQNHRIA